jgi:hypothetical protein
MSVADKLRVEYLQQQDIKQCSLHGSKHKFWLSDLKLGEVTYKLDKLEDGDFRVQTYNELHVENSF